MPTVPTLDAPTVGLSGGSNATFAQDQAPDVAGQELSAVGRDATTAGRYLGQLAGTMQHQANLVRNQDQLNQLKEGLLDLTYNQQTGFTQARGKDALDRASGMSLSDEYMTKARDLYSQLSDGMGNDQQRAMFARDAAPLLQGFEQHTMTHQNQEFRTYTESVRNGTIANGINSIQLNYANPDQIDKELENINAAVADKGRLNGMSAEWIEAEQRNMTSRGLTVAINAAMENGNHIYAQALLDKYQDRIQGNDFLRIQGNVTKERNTQLGNTYGATAVDQAFSAAHGGYEIPANAPISSVQPTGSVKGSRGIRNNNPGNIVKSNLTWAGQVDGGDSKFVTFATPEAGISAMAKNLIAYQASHGLNTVSGIINRWAPGSENNTQAYVQRVSSLLGVGPNQQLNLRDPGTLQALCTAIIVHENGGTPYSKQQIGAGVAAAIGKAALPKQPQQAQLPQPYQPQQPTLDQVVTRLRNDPTLAVNPQALSAAITSATQQFQTRMQSMKQQDDQNVATAMQMIEQNGGDFSKLPYSVRAALPPKEIPGLMQYAANYSKGQDSTNMAVYQKLATDNSYLKSMSDQEFYKLKRVLSQSDFKQFADKRAALQSGKGSEDPGTVDTGAMNMVLENRLLSLKINPHPNASKDSDDAARVGTIRQYVTNSILQAQQATGKKFNLDQVERHIDSLFAQNVTFKDTFMGYETGTKSQQQMLTMKPNDIPSETRKTLIQAFTRRGNPNPSATELLRAYWEMQSALRGMRGG